MEKPHSVKQSDLREERPLEDRVKFMAILLKLGGDVIAQFREYCIKADPAIYNSIKCLSDEHFAAKLSYLLPLPEVNSAYESLQKKYPLETAEIDSLRVNRSSNARSLSELGEDYDYLL